MPKETTVSGKEVTVNQIKKGDKCLQVRFTNNESPKADIDFTLQDPLKDEKPSTWRRWHLLDGETYKLPLHVIEHLNGLKVPESKYDIDPSTGQLTHISTTMRHRFSCIPVNLGQIMASESDKDE